MGYEKTVTGRIFGITAQPSGRIRLPIGDSTGNAFTSRINPLKGSLMWDRAMFVLNNVSIAGGASGGSWAVTISSDAVRGYTGLKIAQINGLGVDTSSAASVIMDNMHQSAACVMPTHIDIFDAEDQGVPGTITLTCDVIAKQYRGVHSGGGRTAERIIQGTMIQGMSVSGGGFVSGKGFDSDETIAIGTSSTDMGLNHMMLWDNALFWVKQGESQTGTAECSINATIDGVTTEIASTATAAIGATAGDAVPLVNNFYGMCPRPSEIIWTNLSGGVSDARLVVVAKSGRGSMIKT